MNPVLISISVFLSSLSVSSGSFGFEPATVDPSRPNHCYNKETNLHHEDGESWPIIGCGVATCMKITHSAGNSQMMISYESCGSVGYEPPCYTQVVKDAEFPDCCPEVVCPDFQEEQEDLTDTFSNDLTPHIFNNFRNETGKPEINQRFFDQRNEEILRAEQERRLQSLDYADDSENEIPDRERNHSPRLAYYYY